MGGGELCSLVCGQSGEIPWSVEKNTHSLVFCGIFCGCMLGPFDL